MRASIFLQVDEEGWLVWWGKVSGPYRMCGQAMSQAAFVGKARCALAAASSSSVIWAGAVNVLCTTTVFCKGEPSFLVLLRFNAAIQGEQGTHLFNPKPSGVSPGRKFCGDSPSISNIAQVITKNSSRIVGIKIHCLFSCSCTETVGTGLVGQKCRTVT